MLQGKGCANTKPLLLARYSNESFLKGNYCGIGLDSPVYLFRFRFCYEYGGDEYLFSRYPSSPT